MKRTFRYDILPLIQRRWSARSLDSKKIDRDSLLALVEAAHFAPSCFNEQPWRFLIADEPSRHAKVLESLNAGNQEWADQASAFIVILAKKEFAKDQRPNFWHAFDSGTAWGYLSLEAERRGLIAHAMGGFDAKKIRVHFSLPDDLVVLTVVAIGRLGPKDALSPALQEREKPNVRRPLESFLL